MWCVAKSKQKNYELNGGGTGVDTLRVASCASVDDEVRVHGGIPAMGARVVSWPPYPSPR